MTVQSHFSHLIIVRFKKKKKEKKNNLGLVSEIVVSFLHFNLYVLKAFWGYSHHFYCVELPLLPVVLIYHKVSEEDAVYLFIADSNSWHTVSMSLCPAVIQQTASLSVVPAHLAWPQLPARHCRAAAHSEAAFTHLFTVRLAWEEKLKYQITSMQNYLRFKLFTAHINPVRILNTSS